MQRNNCVFNSEIINFFQSFTLTSINSLNCVDLFWALLNRQKMEANTKVVIFGSLGIGKSTVMNTISGEKANFQTGDEAVTQEPAAYKFSADGKEFIVVDTACLNDYNMPLQLWIEKYTKYAKEKADGLPISLLIIAFRANVRPTAE